jgi:hypothetical protein
MEGESRPSARLLTRLALLDCGQLLLLAIAISRQAGTLAINLLVIGGGALVHQFGRHQLMAQAI